MYTHSLKTTYLTDIGQVAEVTQAITGDGEANFDGVIPAGAAAKNITGATNATPIVVTSTAHGFINGDVVVIASVGGNTNANGRFVVANKTDNTFELTGSAGNASYTSGGTARKVVEVTLAFDKDVLKSVLMYASAALDVYTNDALSNTFTMTAGSMIAWNTSSLGSNPFTADVVKLWVHNNAASEATFRVRAVFDLTP